MASYLRLRQVCLVTADLEREAARVRQVLGLEECYRDPNVARYGLQNVLFPIGTDFLEIVSPVEPGTAAGRFLERHAGRHGYMIIMDCDDPEARQAHCESIGVRTANLIRHDAYLGVQLHPKDTGGAMLEFNRTSQGENPRGPYAPAGPAWQQSMRGDVSRRLLSADIECPDPAQFAARWGQILQRPVGTSRQGGARIALDSGGIEFNPASRPDAVLAGVSIEVADPTRVREAARDLDCLDEAGEVRLSGVRVRLVQGT